MSEVTTDPAKTVETEQPKPAKKKAEPKTQRVRSLVGRFLVLHTNTVIGEGEKRIRWTTGFKPRSAKTQVVVD